MVSRKIVYEKKIVEIIESGSESESQSKMVDCFPGGLVVVYDLILDSLARGPYCSRRCAELEGSWIEYFGRALEMNLARGPNDKKKLSKS